MVEHEREATAAFYKWFPFYESDWEPDNFRKEGFLVGYEAGKADGIPQGVLDGYDAGRSSAAQHTAALSQQLDGARGENERLRQQIASHRCYNALLDEALNSGDGTYKP
jgi:hypothetical protein